MNRSSSYFNFSVPVDQLGQAMGRLTGLGATLGDLEPEETNGMIRFSAQIPEERVGDARAIIAAIPSARMILRD